jgi:predicted Zn-dependent protease
MRRIWWIGGLALVVVVLGVVQAASLALFGSLGRDPSLARVAGGAWPFDLARVTGADRLAPVRVELARAALVRREPERADALLAGLPSSANVADLRGQVALANGRAEEAVALFGQAGDVVHAEATIDAVAARDPVAAYDLAAAFVQAVVARNEPAPVRGDAAWRAGQRAAAVASVRPSQAAHYDALAFALYQDAVRDDPTQEAYLLAAGLAALAVGDAPAARDLYRRSVAEVSDSVDGFVGLAVSEAGLGDCAAARAALASAQHFASRQQRVVDPDGAGYDAQARAAFRRCTVTSPSFPR